MAFASIFFCSAAQAKGQAPICDLHIRQDILGPALAELSRQCGVRLLYPYELARTRGINPVAGRRTVSEALEVMLRGSPLTGKLTAGGVITISRLEGRGEREMSRSKRATLLGSVSVIMAGLLGPAAAQAQEAPKSAEVDEVVVSGSRIKRDGFLSPTPVTVLTAENLQDRAPSNMADALNRLPQFLNSISNNQSSTFSAAGNPQGNFLNLRGLGVNRSLILLDGVRVPPTNASGGVDINMLPQTLVKRVEVVTGGASAAYGSDAVVGVVNFILDTEFTGIKGSLQGATSYKGDHDAVKASVALGRPFAGGRGHVLFSAEHFDVAGLRQADRRNGDANILTVGTGAAANPYRVVSDARYPNMVFGGLIASGPLANNRFLPDGSLTRFVQGASTGAGSAIVVGGDGGFHPSSQSLLSGLRTDQLFARVSYELTPAVKAHLQATFGESRNTFDVGAISFTPATITIFADNAFLTPAVRAGLGATPSFTFGTIRRDLPLSTVDLLNNSLTFNAGLEGELGAGWTWDATYVYGAAKQRQISREANLTNLYAGIDAVRDPAGRIVCRAALINPARYSGCVPINLFGEGNVTPEAIAYLRQPSQFQVDNEINIVDLNFQGDIFSTWAGPISVAFGGELRRQTLNQTSNADPAIPRDFSSLRGVPANSLWFARQNVGVAAGKVTVKEAYAEAVVPLARDLPWAQALDLNGAVRVTDYSTTGRVTTWKVGVNYQPFSDLRFRATASRDIAAPGLSQLFAGLQASPSSAATPDPHTNTTGTYLIQNSGNPDLKPEKGSMAVVGFVYSPSWLEGLSVSADVTSLLIEDAITTQQANLQIIDCESSGGTAPVCDLIIRPRPFSDRSAANYPTIVNVVPQNLSKQYSVDVDFEVSYRTALSRLSPGLSGDVGVRVLATYNPTIDRKVSAFNTTQEGAGGTFGGDLVNDGFPKWRGSAEFLYRNGPIEVIVSERFTGRFRRDYFQVFADTKVAPNVIYTDLSLKYALADENRTVAFLTVENLFNKKPPLVPSAQNPGLQYPTNKRAYDVVGTYVTLGLRFRR